MKGNNKINFFESPLRKHFNATDKWRTEEAPIHFVDLFENESQHPVEQPAKRIPQEQEHRLLNEAVQLRQVELPNPERHQQMQQEGLLTPIGVANSLIMSPICIVGPYFGQQDKLDSIVESDEAYDNRFLSTKNEDRQVYSKVGIDEKVEFSDEELVKEELVIPVTPVKRTIKFERVDGDHGTTVRRPHAAPATPATPATPETEVRNRERGLKTLASEAYRLVSSQRRTTYKEVARKLIGSFNDDGDMQIDKRGEMNIKRRVYDALNVLIALNLLKRNGNKVLGKKLDYEPEQEAINKTIEQERLHCREMKRKDTLNRMRAECLHKQHMLDAKKRLKVALQLKSDKFEEFKLNNMNTEDDHQKKIKFPFLVVCHERDSQAKGMPTQLRKDERKASNQKRLYAGAATSTVPAWQASETATTSSFSCFFSKGDKMEIMGELDLISKWQKPAKDNTTSIARTASTAKPRRR